jgi:hypothetical protein
MHEVQCDNLHTDIHKKIKNETKIYKTSPTICNLHNYHADNSTRRPFVCGIDFVTPSIHTINLIRWIWKLNTQIFIFIQ